MQFVTDLSILYCCGKNSARNVVPLLNISLHVSGFEITPSPPECVMVEYSVVRETLGTCFCTRKVTGYLCTMFHTNGLHDIL